MPAVAPLVDKKVKLKLTGKNGNAWNLVGAFTARARVEKWTESEIKLVCDSAMNGDYDHLLATLAAHCVNNGAGKRRQ